MNKNVNCVCSPGYVCDNHDVFYEDELETVIVDLTKEVKDGDTGLHTQDIRGSAV
jgi:hypothetical protein